VAGTDEAVAFMDIRPVNDGHVLVIPRRHAVLVHELDEDSWLGVCALVQRVQGGLYAAGAVRCDAENLYVADGAAAGQEVAHVHVHVVPRFKGDGFGLRFPPEYGRTPERVQLDALAESLRNALRD
jgi:histidine triad (HIT) family protein